MSIYVQDIIHVEIIGLNEEEHRQAHCQSRIMITILIVSLHNNQPMYEPKNTNIIKGDDKV